MTTAYNLWCYLQSHQNVSKKVIWKLAWVTCYITVYLLNQHIRFNSNFISESASHDCMIPSGECDRQKIILSTECHPGVTGLHFVFSSSHWLPRKLTIKSIVIYTKSLRKETVYLSHLSVGAMLSSTLCLSACLSHLLNCKVSQF